MPEYLRQRNIRFRFKKCPAHINQRLLRRALDFYAAALLPNLRRQISVTVEWTYSRKMGCVAEAEYDDTHLPPKNLGIRISARIRGWSVFTTCAHEMVHIKQWATGEMRPYATDEWVRWKGTPCQWDEGIGYWDLPWELDAMSLENGLYAKFKAYYGLKGKDLKALTRHP